MLNSSDTTYLSLLEKADSARENAYCAYSNFKVGAALLTKSGNIIFGSNVENASYGLTNCAERSAIFAAISRGIKPQEIDAIAISATGENFSPCGACRQVIFEMGSQIAVIFRFNGKVVIERISDLLPYSFTITINGQ
ncbi:cytidine deaminase [Geotalea daltonii FRC-32]|uniref:Cytidine deaminase n=1 Tax=Geotalea daltonii (strain DSM 22248 / JCM 15807 / FRC-32) TaxID=316067 RepID=B9M0B0_GEODF|nr:cytidine deaminase [Geotalea daltonii]ACM18947.1 cytidine deaminase [Geotalea daltonii FRC-32]